ncbi:MAG: DsbA family protein [Candidatus Puniceispirillaceae bacterium]
MQNRRHFLKTTSAAAATAGILAAPSLARAEEFNIEAITAPRRLGKDDAPIKVIEFFSMTCSHCGTFHRETWPLVKTNLIDTGSVQFEMHPFPLDGLALRAHVMCRLLPNKGYFAMTEILLKEQSEWVRAADPLKALMSYGRQAGISEEKFNAVMRNRPVLESVVDMRQDAMDDWQISSTPSFVINKDKKISGGRTYDEFVTELSAFGI